MTTHHPVLLSAAIGWLAPRGTDEWWADLTVGGGGHTEALLAATAPRGLVLGLDRDGDILAATRARLAGAGDRLRLVQANFRDVAAVARDLGINALAGGLMDLGTSSFQLENPERGFSFLHEGPLDMRMDRTQTLTAAHLVNHADEEELARIFYEFGEERRSRQLARLVIRSRPFYTTTQLAEVARRAVGRSGKIHPATRAFQALRIAVNEELASLPAGLDGMAHLLAAGGRLVVISFHSLEDRVVKNFFRRGGWDVLTPHVVRPDAAEQRSNPRSRSARLRAAARVGS